MDRFLIAESVQDANIQLGGGNANPGWETPDSRWALTVKAVDTRGEPIEIQIWFTVPQLASIVKKFFADILIREDNGEKTIFAKMLQRLLRKRWAVMSSSTAKMKFADGYCWLPPYDNLEE